MGTRNVESDTARSESDRCRGILWLAPQQLPVAVHAGIELEQHGGELHAADLPVKARLGQIEAFQLALGLVSAKEDVPSTDPDRGSTG